MSTSPASARRLIAANEAAARDFPSMLHGVNVMIWALTYPEVRFQLIDWEETWARPMASQLRIAWRASPHDPRLAEVVQHIKDADPVADCILEHDVTTVTHPNGDRRRLYLPHQDEEVEVEFVAFGRLGNNIRLMVVMPADIVQHAKDAMPSTIASGLMLNGSWTEQSSEQAAAAPANECSD
ncbi:hypothetical protein ACH41H_38765 [Streptomyces sp. NPDC020800]|uniref:MmyB family transcriptional regulator n=1 Tax=Streptomyces sp. NPDC020800 TaxID=3365092 RepID=UPI003797DC86